MAPQYRRAPLQEAIIDIQVADVVDYRTAAKAAVALRERYSSEDELRSYRFEVQNDSGKVKVSADLVGKRLLSADASQVRVCKLDGYSASALPPYPGWDAFMHAASEDWAIWAKVSKPLRYSRLGVRYISRLDIPLSQAAEADWPSKYVRFWNNFPLGTIANPSGYVSLLNGTSSDEEISYTIQSSSIASPLYAHASLQLDIDVWTGEHLNQGGAALWDRASVLHEETSRIFETLVTEQARTLFS